VAQKCTFTGFRIASVMSMAITRAETPHGALRLKCHRLVYLKVKKQKKKPKQEIRRQLACHRFLVSISFTS
jgi:hypothetical protein